MVMHARKLPRLNDGYFDRNQAHPYENSSKYSSKLKLGSRYNDKVRESPSNGSNHGRSNSPDSRHSPRYHKFSYNQRLKERDKDHERGSSKSPAYKDRISKSSLGSGSSSNNKDQHSSKSCSSDVSTHRTNHDRSHIEESKEKRQQVGDWSEHVSSSGKKYYYNCKTEVSQWEKPKEWIEWEKQQGIYKSSSSSGGGSDSSSRSKPRGHERPVTSSTSSGACNSRQGEKHSSSSATPSSSTRAYQHSSRTHNDVRWSTASASRNADPRKDSQTQDMDISPASSGTPTSWHESQPQSRNVTPSSQAAPSLLLSPSQVTLANLPKMMSQLAGTRGLPNLDDMSPQEAFRTIQQALQLTKQAQTSGLSQATTSCVTQAESLKGTSPSMYQALTTPITSHRAGQSSSRVCMPGLPLPAGLQGPPLTPSTLDSKVPSTVDRRDGAASPGSDYSAHSSRRDSPTSSVSSLHSITGTGTSSLASAVLKPAVPSLTPSLANYYNEALISHVTGWQADHAERQANRYSEEAHTLGSLNCTRVSAELKMARSLVRLAEIQATLQEQRTLFLRQQIKELEEQKSQVTFMSDS